MANSEEEKTLESLIRDLKEKVSCIKSFNMINDVNTHCDRVENEIKSTTSAAIKRLQDNEEELISRMRKFREETIAANSEFMAEVEQGLHDDFSCLLEMKQVDDLSIQIEKLELEGSEVSKNGPDGASTTVDVEPKKRQANELICKVQKLHKKFLAWLYPKHQLQFVANQLLALDKYAVGRLFEMYLGGSGEKLYSVINSTVHVLQMPQLDITQTAIILRSNQLLLGSAAGQISLVENNFEASDIGELVISEAYNHEPKKPITALSEMNSGSIFGWTKNGQTFHFIPGTRLKTKNLICHSDIFYCQQLNDGYLAAISLDDRIQLKGRYILDSLPCHFIKGHGSTRFPCRFGVLSNNWIVTCSNNSDAEEGMLRLWDPKSGERVHEKSSGMKQVCTLAVLSNNLVVLASMDGSLKLIKVTDDSTGKMIIDANVSQHANFIEVLHDNQIAVVDSLNRIQVWDLDLEFDLKFKLIQTYETGHTDEITSCFLNHRKSLLVTTSLDGSVRVFKIAFDVGFINI